MAPHTRREALLGLVSGAFSGLAGCSDTIQSGARDSGKTVTVEQPGCPPWDATQILSPSEERLTVNHEVSGPLGGDPTQWDEIISIQNTSDSPVDLSRYSVLFERDEQFQFENLVLIPSARVTVVTFGDPPISTKTGCPKYDYTRKADLDEPLLQDRETRITLVEPDGNHLFQTQIELQG